jgi:hypothetical protein
MWSTALYTGRLSSRTLLQRLSAALRLERWACSRGFERLCHAPPYQSRRSAQFFTGKYSSLEAPAKRGLL